MSPPPRPTPPVTDKMMAVVTQQMNPQWAAEQQQKATSAQWAVEVQRAAGETAGAATPAAGQTMVSPASSYETPASPMSSMAHDG